MNEKLLLVRTVHNLGTIWQGDKVIVCNSKFIITEYTPLNN